MEGRFEAANALKEIAEARQRRFESSLERAEAELEAVRSTTRITAPFSGQVIERRVDVGNLATPGTPLAVLDQDGPLCAEVSVEESHAGRIHVGDFAAVWLEGAIESIQGQVSEVFPAVDARTRTFLVKVELPANLSATSEFLPRPGKFVRVELTVGETERMVVPESAILRKGQLEMVYVVENDRTRLRLVTLGRREDSQIEILSGLNEGEKVVSKPGADLGEDVRVVTR